jgi:hypothetical protein
MRGFYRLQTKTHDSGWFENLITDNGLNILGTVNGSPISWFSVGTGNSTPAFTDVAMSGPLANSNNVVASSGLGNQGAEGYCYWRQTNRFNPLGSNNNLQEVGCGPNGSSLFSRALILDGGGAPTVFPWGATESLDVSYELRLYPPAADTNTVMTVTGVNYNITIRPYFVQNWRPLPWYSGAGFGNAVATDGVLGSRVTSITGTGISSTGYSESPYVNSSLVRDLSWVWGLAAGTKNISALSFPISKTSSAGAPVDGHDFQVGITGGGSGFIPKTGSNILTLNWRHSWARYP